MVQVEMEAVLYAIETCVEVLRDALVQLVIFGGVIPEQILV